MDAICSDSSLPADAQPTHPRLDHGSANGDRPCAISSTSFVAIQGPSGKLAELVISLVVWLGQLHELREPVGSPASGHVLHLGTEHHEATRSRWANHTNSICNLLFHLLADS